MFFANIKRCTCASDTIYTIDNCTFEAVRPGYLLYGGEGIRNYPQEKFKSALTIVANVQKSDDGYFVDIGTENGLVSNFKDGSYVLVDGEKILYKKILKDKIILESNKDITNKEAIINGEYNGYSILSNFFNDTLLQEIQTRILNCVDDFPQKFEKIIISDTPTIEHLTKNINSTDISKSKTLFKNNKLEYFESQILETRIVEYDGWVGYNATENVKIGDFLATVFNGYADSFPCFLSNKNCFIYVENIDKKLIKCEIYGKISMDQVIIKIPEEEVGKIFSGSKVVFFDIKNNIDFYDYIKKYNVTEEEINFLFKYNKRSNKIML